MGFWTNVTIGFLFNAIVLFESFTLGQREDAHQILLDIKKSMATLENRMTNLENKFSQVNLVEHGYQLTSVQQTVQKSTTVLSDLVTRMTRVETALEKLQVTDQERFKSCNSQFGQSVAANQKSQVDMLREHISSMLQEVRDLVRAGISKLLVRLDNISSGSGSSSISGSGGPTDQSLREIKEQLQNIKDKLAGSLPLTGVERNGGLKNSVEEFKALAENTIEKFVKQINSTEDRLSSTVVKLMSMPSKLSKVTQETLPGEISKLQNLLSLASNNGPIIRSLRLIQQKLQVTPESCSPVTPDIQPLLDNAMASVNEITTTYNKHLVGINDSIAKINEIVIQIETVVRRYKTDSDRL